MTAPRPEAVELGVMALVKFNLTDDERHWLVGVIDAALTAARADEREQRQSEPRSEEWAALDEARDEMAALRDHVRTALARYEDMRQNVVAYGGGFKTEGFVRDCDAAMDALDRAIREAR